MAEGNGSNGPAGPNGAAGSPENGAAKKPVTVLVEGAKAVGAQAAEEAAPGDRAHLVIQLRPADPAAVVAEPHELDGIGVGSTGDDCAWDHRWRALPLLFRARSGRPESAAGGNT